MKNLLKTVVLAGVLFLPASASAQVSFGVRIGPPPPPRAYRVPPSPGPEYIWVEGYNYPVNGHYVWHDGYWTRPPYAGAYWVAPYYAGHRYVTGHWEGNHGVVRHDHRWDKDRRRDERWRR